MITKQQLKIILFSSAILLLIIIYGSFDPSSSHFFPKCPVKTAFHIDCPGCGSQRAIHALLHFDVVQAFKFNALLVIALPYLALALGLTLIKNPSEKITSLRNRLYGHHATLIVLGVVVFFGVFRNIL